MPNTELPLYRDSAIKYENLKTVVETKSNLRVLKSLGRGSFGSVVLARRDGGHLFAVKVLKTTSRKPDSSVRMEAKINKAIGIHRRIVRLHSVFYSSSMGLYGMAFDFANWGSLLKLVEQFYRHDQRVPEALIWSIFKDIAEALLYLHSGLTAPDFKSPVQDWGGTIIHGDVSPANIVLGPAASWDKLGRRYPGARLVDFGLSVSVQDPSYGPQRLTGTQYYMPPESQTTPKADVFGLGMCMFFAGKYRILPNSDEILAEAQHWSQTERRLGTLHETLLYRMIFKAIQPDPIQRVDSGVLAADLEILAREMRSKYFEPLPRWAYPDHGGLAD